MCSILSDANRAGALSGHSLPKGGLASVDRHVRSVLDVGSFSVWWAVLSDCRALATKRVHRTLHAKIRGRGESSAVELLNHVAGKAQNHRNLEVQAELGKHRLEGESQFDRTCEQTTTQGSHRSPQTASSRAIFPSSAQQKAFNPLPNPGLGAA